ncbi:insulinase family protein [Porphyromonadaceae bacterium OttesenSCG-928-L07]|nr:insulinase family protein [Porphyromonadaceae bacterium OttesenSCG-928-L07]MDL2251258.1 insulinase family protein [Odoribacter sp. OttesenSCG-928-J03]
MSYQTHILKNGLKIIHQHTESKAAHCGLMIGVGSRDEQEGEKGITHFIEHVIFKGTKKRKAFHILSRLEDVGGELNAYTTKEDTCIYATFLPQNYERTLELFSDIVFNSIFPEKEMEKEKEVVIDEINSYKDSPGELIYDDFEELIFENDSIGGNILGDEYSVRAFTREQILEFVRKNYTPHRMVISSIGNFDFDKLVQLVEKYFGMITGDDNIPHRQTPGLYIPRTKTIEMDTHQTHCIMGNRAFGYKEDKRIPLSLLVDLLGGSGMNSRLNLNIREKHGLAYNVEAGYTSYSDTGVFSIYFGCDAEDLKKCMRLCRSELEKLYAKPLGEMQLKKIKTQTTGRMTLSSENYESMMLAIGKSFLVYGKVDSTEDLYKKVMEVDAKTLQDVAAEVFDTEKLSILTYK